VRHIIRWSLTAAVRNADVWHLSDQLTLPEALAAAQREQFPYLVQRRLEFGVSGKLVRDSGNSLVRVAGVPLRPPLSHPWHTQCLRCPCAAQFPALRDAECWRDVHEFENEHDGHLVRILLQTDKSLVDMGEVIVVELDRESD
jgi:hypothetical protein